MSVARTAQNPGTILVCRRLVREGGMQADQIKPGDVVNTPSIGKLMVGEATQFKDEGVWMTHLAFPAMPGFPSYRTVMPSTTEVDAERL